MVQEKRPSGLKPSPFFIMLYYGLMFALLFFLLSLTVQKASRTHNWSSVLAYDVHKIIFHFLAVDIRVLL